MRSAPVAALALALTLTTVPAARAATGAAFVESRLSSSGGFVEVGAGAPSVTDTAWAVMGLRAAGVDPARLRRPGGRTPVGYLGALAHTWTSVYDLERGVLAAAALGYNPRTFGGSAMWSRFTAQVHAGGGIGAALNSTYWGALALEAARARVPARTVGLIEANQRRYGGYGWTYGAAADTNDTAAAVLALRRAGVSCTNRAVARAIGYLDATQTAAHGYPLQPGAAADSQSTSFAIQARQACGLPNGRAQAWLAARRLPSGAYNYQPRVPLTPLWVTAQVLPAVYDRPYPAR
ncbi:MAG TPA: hypothetical protein VMU66_04645 [Gaiellales bacterium]|nr:hypothetical protein [Gaiellales bacterium]